MLANIKAVKVKPKKGRVKDLWRIEAPSGVVAGPDALGGVSHRRWPGAGDGHAGCVSLRYPCQLPRTLPSPGVCPATSGRPGDLRGRHRGPRPPPDGGRPPPRRAEGGSHPGERGPEGPRSLGGPQEAAQTAGEEGPRPGGVGGTGPRRRGAGLAGRAPQGVAVRRRRGRRLGGAREPPRRTRIPSSRASPHRPSSRRSGGLRPQLLVCGHSHIPFTRRIAGVRVVNCGSVGLPVDGDPRGALALCEFAGQGRVTCRILRFAYPVEPVLADLRSRGATGVAAEVYRIGTTTIAE